MFHECPRLPPITSRGLFLKNTESVYLKGNTTIAKLFGFSRKELLVGMTDYDLPCRAAEFAEVFQKQDKYVIQNSRTIRVIDTHQYANAEWKIILSITKPVVDPKTKEVIGVISDLADITKLFIQINYLQFGVKIQPKNILQAGSYMLGEQLNFKLNQRQLECLLLLLRGKWTSEHNSSKTCGFKT